MKPDQLTPGEPSMSHAQGRVEAKVKQSLRCSAEQLYDAWLDPTQIREWMARSLKTIGLAGDIQRVETDPRVGGKFCFSDLRNGAEAIHVGRYLALDRPNQIVFTWIVGSTVEEAEKEGNPSKVTLMTESAAELAAGGCVATMVHEMDAKWAEYVSRTEASWTRMLKAIEALVAEKA